MLKMNKQKKLTYKKSIIRNAEQSKPKTVVILQPEVQSCSGTSQAALSEQATSTYEAALAKNAKSELQSPELNSALRIARKIESLENIRPRKIKSVSDLDMKNQLAVDERASKQLNFPYNQHVYKDLIPLCTKAQPPPLPSISREIPLHKDEEPVLSDFFTPKVLREYSFEVPVQARNKTLNKHFDGLKLYRTMRNWD